jgi:hypothetical protein
MFLFLLVCLNFLALPIPLTGSFPSATAEYHSATVK